MGTNINEFNAVLESQKRQVVAQFLEFHKAVSLTAYQYITAKANGDYGSPRWSGRYARSHNISIGNIDPSIVAPLQTDARWPDPPANPYGNKPLSYASNILQKLKPFDVVYISNSLPYARRLEQGYSLQAPQGVYQVTALAVSLKFKDAKFGSFLK